MCPCKDAEAAWQAEVAAGKKNWENRNKKSVHQYQAAMMQRCCCPVLWSSIEVSLHVAKKNKNCCRAAFKVKEESGWERGFAPNFSVVEKQAEKAWFAIWADFNGHTHTSLSLAAPFHFYHRHPLCCLCVTVWIHTFTASAPHSKHQLPAYATSTFCHRYLCYSLENWQMSQCSVSQYQCMNTERKGSKPGKRLCLWPWLSEGKEQWILGTLSLSLCMAMGVGGDLWREWWVLGIYHVYVLGRGGGVKVNLTLTRMG